MAALHATFVLVHNAKYEGSVPSTAPLPPAVLDTAAVTVAEASAPGQFRLLCDVSAAQLQRDVDQVVAGRPAAEPVVVAFVGHTSRGDAGQGVAWLGIDGAAAPVGDLLASIRQRRGPKVPIIAFTCATNATAATATTTPTVAWKPTRVANTASVQAGSGGTPAAFLNSLCRSMDAHHRFSHAVSALSSTVSGDGPLVESSLVGDFHVFGGGGGAAGAQPLDCDTEAEGTAFDCIGCYAGDGGGEDDDTRSAQTFGKPLKRLVQDDRVLPLEEFELRQVQQHVAAHCDRATLFVTGVLSLAVPDDTEETWDGGSRSFAVARSGTGGGWLEAAPAGAQLPPLAVLVAVAGQTRTATSLRVNPRCFNAAWVEASSPVNAVASGFLPSVPNGVASVAALLERGLPLAVVLGALGVPTFGRFDPVFWAPFHFSRARVGKFIDLNWSAALRPELRGAPEALKAQVRAGLGRLIDGSDWLDCEQLAAEHVATFVRPEWAAAFISRIRRQQHKRMTLSKFLWLLKGGHQKPLRDISPDVSCAQQ